MKSPEMPTLPQTLAQWQGAAGNIEIKVEQRNTIKIAVYVNGAFVAEGDTQHITHRATLAKMPRDAEGKQTCYLLCSKVAVNAERGEEITRRLKAIRQQAADAAWWTECRQKYPAQIAEAAASGKRVLITEDTELVNCSDGFRMKGSALYAYPDGRVEWVKVNDFVG